MAFQWSSRVTSIWSLALLMTTAVTAQQISASNATSDIPDASVSPRFFVNATGIDTFQIAPVGRGLGMPQSVFQNFEENGQLIDYATVNGSASLDNSIDLVSCDDDDAGVMGPSAIFNTVIETSPLAVILYSTQSQFCNANSLSTIPWRIGIFTTLDPKNASILVNQLANMSGVAKARVFPDKSAYTNATGPGSSSYAYDGQGRPGTTAVAMIVLYTITGLITALFVLIIITGAMRAHRHPERYGVRNIPGRPRQSRAKGIARAMLETLPVVKFGDHDNLPKKETNDVEMTGKAEETETAAKDGTKTTAAAVPVDETQRNNSATPSTTAKNNADGMNESGELGCSICTEDFNKGEEVRVLPCNHKFHPECVDPWLLNISGTCPLCRIDLQPPNPRSDEATEGGERNDAITPAERSAFGVAPQGGERSSVIMASRLSMPNGNQTTFMQNLRAAAGATGEDRVAVLRRFRQERRGQAAAVEGETTEEERRGVARRLRERFRVRTRRQGEETMPTPTYRAASAGQI